MPNHLTPLHTQRPGRHRRDTPHHTRPGWSIAPARGLLTGPAAVAVLCCLLGIAIVLVPAVTR